MNVLILTPDRVGSTLLQRVLTVYLLGQNVDRPVINLHELTNGLIKYYNPVTNSEVLGKPNNTNWGYYQTLPEIVELLKSVDHYKTSRLAHYHIVNRQDIINDQIKFYEYLNKDFFIISCRRENLFEHALSWGIQSFSKTLNVYSAYEKFISFESIYKNKIKLTEQSLKIYLQKYKKYIEWCDTYFNVQSYFNYDKDIADLENYVLSLDFMKTKPKISWEQMFGQDFKDFNACHRLLPNLKLLPAQGTKSLSYFNIPSKAKWKLLKGSDWPEQPEDFENKKQHLPAEIKNEIENFFGGNLLVTDSQYHFLEKNLDLYQQTNKQITKLIDDGFLVTGIPIKLQSLSEKKIIIENFDECVNWYNEWVEEHNFGKSYTNTDIEKISYEEDIVLDAPLQLQIK